LLSERIKQMTMIDEIAKLEKEIDQCKAKIKSIKDASRSEMLNTIVEAREEYREAASKLNSRLAEYQKMYPTATPFTWHKVSAMKSRVQILLEIDSEATWIPSDGASGVSSELEDMITEALEQCIDGLTVNKIKVVVNE
jgi:vacuolar-type H+-ATPase subunit I/STV1